MGKNLLGKEIGKGLCQRKDGTFSARIVVNRKRREKHFKKISEARRWMTEMEYAKAHNTMISDRILVDEWFWKWLETYKKDIVSRNTYLGYRNNYIHHIKDYIGFAKLCDVKPIDCQNILNIMYDGGKAYGTMLLVRITLHAMFDGAINEELLIKNPVTSNVKCKQREVEEQRVLTNEEQIEFLNCAKESMYYNAYQLVLNTGLRAGEIGGLKWCDIDFEKKQLSVTRTLLYAKEKGGYYFGVPKTRGSKRVVPLTELAVQILKEQKKQKFKMRNRSNNWNTTPEHEDLVFSTVNGQPTGTSTYSNNINRIVTRINVERRAEAKAFDKEFEEFSPMHMHTLRHTFATRCIESGIKPNVVQKILGHSTISVTMDMYVHTLEDEKAKEIKKVESLYDSQVKKMVR